MSLHIMFHDLSNCTFPQEYMERKLAYFFPGEDQSGALARLVLTGYSAGPLETVPCATAEQLPVLGDDERSRVLREEMDMFVSLVDRLSPLLEGESLLESDFYTLLVGPFREYPVGTPVLIRRTSQATLYYFYNYARVDETGKFSYLKQDQSELENGLSAIENSSLPMTSASNSIWADLLMELVKGIVGEIGSRIGSEALQAIFPSGQGIDYRTMLNDFAVLIAEANREQTISEQGGLLNGVLQNHSEYYVPRRSVAKKKELYNQLLAYHNSLGSICGTLSYKNGTDYTQSGLALYVNAVSLHLAIYQEMALQDPNTDDPKKSSNIQSIIYLSKNACQYVRAKCNEIQEQKLQQRQAKISRILNNPFCDGNVCKSRYYFHDSETGYRSGYYEQCGCKDDPSARCSAARTTYYNQRSDEKTAWLNSQMKWMRDIADQWAKLEHNPLPA